MSKRRAQANEPSMPQIARFGPAIDRWVPSPRDTYKRQIEAIAAAFRAMTDEERSEMIARSLDDPDYENFPEPLQCFQVDASELDKIAAQRSAP